MLTQYIRSKGSSFAPVDTLEQVGDVLLKPVRFVCGCFVRVDSELESTLLPAASIIHRICIGVLLTVCCPITIPMSIIGTICVLTSTSYQQEKTRNSSLETPSDSALKVEVEQTPNVEISILPDASKEVEEAEIEEVSFNNRLEESKDGLILESEEQELSDELIVLPEQELKHSTWKKTSLLGGTLLLGASFLYFAEPQHYESLGLKCADIFNKSNFDSLIAPFAVQLGLPLIRSTCYVSALFLGTRKTVEGISSLAYRIFSRKQPSEVREISAFQNHLLRDSLLVLGLIGAGLWVEGVESDLNLYLQRLEMDKSFLSQIIQGNYSEGLLRKASSYLPFENIPYDSESDGVEELFASPFFQEQVKPLIYTAIYSLQKMRLTPLKTHSSIELAWGAPLSGLGFAEDELPQILFRYDLKKNLQKFTDF